MNSYRENLQDSVGASLNALYAQKQKLDSKSLSDQYNLYHAQGAQLTAIETLDSDQDKAQTIWEINQKGVEGESIMTNLLSSATLMQTNTATLTGNSATAAANIQIAANAIAKIAADIGSALNVASTYCYQTDIYKKTVEANSYIRETANLAEFASKQAMEASYASAEVITKELLDAANASKADLDTLTAATQGQQATLTAQISTDQKALETAAQTERKAEGSLKDTDRETDAIDRAVTNTNTSLNYGLTIMVTGESGFTVSFNDYQQPFVSPDRTVEALLGATSSDGIIPAAAPEYSVFVCKADKASSIKPEMIESLYSAENPAFVKTQAGAHDDLQEAQFTTDNQDIDGDPIIQGVSYVAFMYGEVNQKYQKYINSYSNLLSCPSDSFTLLFSLPSAQDIDVDYSIRSKTTTVQFELDSSEMADVSEFRVMFLPTAQPENGFETAPGGANSDVSFYFNKAIAEQVSPANYIVVEKGSESIDIPLDMTDNFGSPLQVQSRYVPVVLTTCATDSNQYDPQLAISATTFVWHGESSVIASMAEPETKKTTTRAKKKASNPAEDSSSDDQPEQE